MRGAGAHRSGQPTNQRGFRGERACSWFKRRVPRKSVTTSQSWFKCVSHCYENTRGLPTRLRCGVTLRGHRHCRHCFVFFLKGARIGSFRLGIFRIAESPGVWGRERHFSGDVRDSEVTGHSSGVRATPQSLRACVCVRLECGELFKKKKKITIQRPMSVCARSCPCSSAL